MLWAKTFAGQATTLSGGGTSYAVSQGSAIAVDSSGDVFVAGGFSGTVKLTGGSGVTTIVAPSSTNEIYLTKLNPSGNVLWADVVAGTTYDDDQAYALALDGTGGAVIAGSFEDSATFGSTTLTASGVFEAFAARVNASGAFLWAVATQGTPGSNAEIHGLAVNRRGQRRSRRLLFEHGGLRPGLEQDDLDLDGLRRRRPLEAQQQREFPLGSRLRLDGLRCRHGRRRRCLGQYIRDRGLLRHGQLRHGFQTSLDHGWANLRHLRPQGGP